MGFINLFNKGTLLPNGELKTVKTDGCY